MSRRLVIFDCDGTLVDSQDAIVRSMDGAFRALGLAPPPRSRTLSIVGLSLPEAIAALAPGAGAPTWAGLVENYRRAAGEVRASATADPLFPGALETIQTLAARADIALAIATGKSRRGVDRLIAQQSWRDHFVSLQTADDNPSKPHPAMIERAMAEAGIAADATVMIGDTTFDMAMARAAGVGAIGVGWGYHPVAELARAGAHTTVGDFTGLIAACDGLLAQLGGGR